MDQLATNSVGSRLIKKWSSADGITLLTGWSRDGLSKREISERMNVSAQTLYALMSASETIRDALSVGAEVTDYKVENALLKAALGFKKKEVKTITVLKGGKVVEQRKEVTEGEQAPNVYAIQSWLYNRRPDKWMKNPEQKIKIESDDLVSIVVTRAGDDETGTRPKLESSVNDSVTVRGMTEEEKREANKREKEKEIDKNSVDYWPDDWVDD